MDIWSWLLWFLLLSLYFFIFSSFLSSNLNIELLSFFGLDQGDSFLFFPLTIFGELTLNFFNSWLLILEFSLFLFLLWIKLLTIINQKFTVFNMCSVFLRFDDRILFSSLFIFLIFSLLFFFPCDIALLFC